MEEKLLELLESKDVIDIIESKDHLELAKYIGRNLCEFTLDDEKYIDIFWDTAFNKSWLYVSEEMVSEQFGYKKAKDMMKDFYKKLENEYEVDIDYKIVDKNHILVKSRSGSFPTRKIPHNKKFYIITGETYKALLASAHTKQGKSTRRYFIKIESLANYTNQLIFRYIEHNQKTQIAKLEKRQMRLESFVKNIKRLEKTQIFYLATVL
jgi:phage anti-repressor protein